MLKMIPKKYLYWFLGVILIACSALIYFVYGDYYPSTDDAYVGANSVSVATQVSGNIAQVEVVDNQAVKAGQILFTLDPQPFELSLQNAMIQRSILNRQMQVAQAKLNAAKYNAMGAKALLVQKEDYFDKLRQLYAEHDIAENDLEVAYAKQQAARANYAANLAVIQQALNQIAYYRLQGVAEQTLINQDKISLSYTVVKAPFSGAVAHFNLQPGQVVNAGQNLFILVNKQQFWVDANFNETQVERIAVGQKAAITIDLYGARKFTGVVASISPASNVALSVFPPENFAGNWVKIPQRIPVRIDLNHINQDMVLPIGASAEVTVNTVGGVPS